MKYDQWMEFIILFLAFQFLQTFQRFDAKKILLKTFANIVKKNRRNIFKSCNIFIN